MKLVRLAVLALSLWNSSAWATTAVMGPGGGGAFNHVATSGLSGGRVLAASDNSGLYGRNGTSSDWLRIGSTDSIYTNNIYSVAFDPFMPSRVIIGTGNGIYTSTNSGATWSPPTIYDNSNTQITVTNNVTAAGWAYCSGGTIDSAACFVAWADDGSAHDIKVAISQDRGLSFKLTYATSISDNNRTPIKILEDPWTSGSNGRRIYVLFGHDGSSNASLGNAVHEIWRTTDGGNSAWGQVTGGACNATGGVMDIAFLPNGPTPEGQSPTSRLIVSASTATTTKDGETVPNLKVGGLWEYDTSVGGGTWRNSGNAMAVWSTSFAPTGAVWSDGTNEYMLNISVDTGAGCTPASGSAPGIWFKPAKNDTCKVRCMDDGTGTGGWDVGWTSCGLARGPAPGDNVARTCSPMVGSAPALYVDGYQFVYRYTGTVYGGTPTKGTFVAEYASGSSSATNTKRLDNANIAMLALDVPNGYIWAGYYDIGLWKYDGSSWTNHNDTDFGWVSGSDSYGGNVNGIVLDGTTVYVTAATSSKQNRWKLYKSTSSGAYNTFSAVGNLPYTEYANGGSSGEGGTFLNSLTRDPVTGRFWVCLRDSSTSRVLRGTVWYADDPASSSGWTEASGDINQLGLMVVRAYNGTVLVGGFGGLWRYTSSTGWDRVTDIVEPTPISSSSGGTYDNANSRLHRHLWYGVQDIYRDPARGYWYVTCYAPPSGTWTSGSKGVFLSTDDGATFAQMATSGGLSMDRKGYRAVTVDSCGRRIWVTSGAGFCSPVDGAGFYNTAGLEICRWDTTQTPQKLKVVAAATDDEWGYPWGHAVASDDYYVYVGAPGYGVHKVTTVGWCSSGGGGCDDPNGCETERPGASATLPHEEQAPDISRRRVFTLAEARDKVYFDITGRRTFVDRAGVYFDPVIKDGRVVSRKTIIVVP